VTTLLRLKPEPEYLVELGSGKGDIKVFQSTPHGLAPTTKDEKAGHFSDKH